MILAEDRARKRFIFKHPDLQDKKPLLTEGEQNALYDTFKTPQEIKLYNKWFEYDRTIVNSMNNLQALLFEVEKNFSNLRGYLFLWDALQNAELLANIILHEIKDPEQRKQIAKEGAEAVSLSFAKITTDTEGYIFVNIEAETELPQGKKPGETYVYSLLSLINNVKKQAVASAIRFISWERATLDYMEEEGFNVETYKDMIRTIEGAVYTPIVAWDKYLAVEKSFLRTPNPRGDKLKNKYSLAPDISELEVDEKIYNYYKVTFLRNEE
jgi:hypothetical protein